MFIYKILETDSGPIAQILYEDNVIDECGPWENLGACIEWADNYVQAKNSGTQEPQEYL
jgi:hypothetical protein